MSIVRALFAWRELMSDDVRQDEQTIARFGLDTSPSSQRIAAVLRPTSSRLIRGIVQIAARESVPIYPVSTGRNWGYGTAIPPAPDCVIVDLSRLRELRVDERLGTATVEPGVTQSDLHRYLVERKLPFLVPTTGAGPNCSLLGNALERGFGITPYADHFAAVTSIEAVLPNGEDYRTPFAELGATNADPIFKWGLGPYLDGLFSQGGFGVVTRMTLALARKAERIVAMFFSVDEDSRLERAVEELQELLNACGSAIGGVNLMNRARMQAMSRGWNGGVSAATLIGTKQFPAWTGAGAIYGCAGVVRAVMRQARATLGRGGIQVRFVDPARINRLQNLLSRLPSWALPKSRLRLKTLNPALKLLMGEPSEVALPLAYAGKRSAPSERDFDPARDRCGLYWYAPIVPMIPGEVRKFVNLVQHVTSAHGIASPVTLTSLSNRCFDGTVPLLFDCDDPAQSGAAEQCYRDLFESGRRQGFVPYRIGSQFMPLAVRPEMASWRLIATLKSAIDPKGILAPGRYAPPLACRDVSGLYLG